MASSSYGLFAQGPHIGDYEIRTYSFPDLEGEIAKLRRSLGGSLHEWDRQELVSRRLLQLIQETKSPCFLLPAVLEFLDRALQEELVAHLPFIHFELYLNQFSGLSPEENLDVRSKIAGKRVPRDSYQIYFPIGMGKSYPGTHFVTAHSSPDLDTTIASFWGWLDAFAARVADGLHVWNLPGGDELTHVEIDQLFREIFGPRSIVQVAKTRSQLTLSGVDLISQRGFVKKGQDASPLVEDCDASGCTVVVVDTAGLYLGDWRAIDVERVRQVTLLLGNALRWFEKRLHLGLVRVLGGASVLQKDLPLFFAGQWALTLSEAEPTEEWSPRQKELAELYLKRVLGLELGLAATFSDLATALAQRGVHRMEGLKQEQLKGGEPKGLFDEKGKLKEERGPIFHYLTTVLESSSEAMRTTRAGLESLRWSLQIKREVFGSEPRRITPRTDLEEIRGLMGNETSLTVTIEDGKGAFFPLGVVHAADLYRPTLGTVSLRDFSNREETKVPPYLEVISVIDHHKMNLGTSIPPLMRISDMQSSNSTLAELSFLINDYYSSLGMSIEEIDAQLKRALKNASERRVAARLLQRRSSCESSNYWVDPVREFVEYLHFLYAILDDTDLLAKVSYRDVEVVAGLLTRLKSLLQKEEIELLHYDDLPRDQQFACRAAARILQNVDMYSLYRKTYAAKEAAIDAQMKAASLGQKNFLFADTKIQNGCCRGGQIKLFPNNFPLFQQHVGKLRYVWAEEAALFARERPEVDLHMLMVSTIAGAEDQFSGVAPSYQHKDELWIWIPGTETSISHLKTFLGAFRAAPGLANGALELRLSSGERMALYEELFRESFFMLPTSVIKEKTPDAVAVLAFRPGLLNSRKTMVSPYLPK